MKKVIAITGPSNSGKTTLIRKIIQKLKDKYKIAVIKHDPKDKAIFDNPQKDSGKFFSAGANVAVLSPTRTTLFKHSPSTLKETIKLFGDFNLLLVEGLKTWELQRIGVFRNKLDLDYIPYLQAIAIDDSIDKESLYNLDVTILNLNNIEEIISYILTHAKDLDGSDI